MGRFNLKSFFLGIGIGIIITAIAGLIYAAGQDPMEGLSKEQIMNQAEKYGMIRPTILNGINTAAGAESTVSGELTGIPEESTSDNSKEITSNTK